MQATLSEVIELKADVLVIGGGAGLRAAISAREGGADVLLVSKLRPGHGNNTAIAAGAFATAGGWRAPGTILRLQTGRPTQRPLYQ